MATKKKATAKEAKATATAQPAAPQTQAQATAQPGQTGSDLSIGDLKNLATIIDVASTRGAFRANEMATVGVMYNKLSSFLARVAPEPKPEDKSAQPSEAKK